MSLSWRVLAFGCTHLTQVLRAKRPISSAVQPRILLAETLMYAAIISLPHLQPAPLMPLIDILLWLHSRLEDKQNSWKCLEGTSMVSLGALWSNEYWRMRRTLSGGEAGLKFFRAQFWGGSPSEGVWSPNSTLRIQNSFLSLYFH